MSFYKNNNFVGEPIIKSIFVLGIPIILNNLLQTAYNLADTFWLGRVSAEALSAASLSFPIIFFIISLGNGISIVGSILVAQYKGRENQRKIDYISAQTLVSIFFISVFLSILGYFITPYIIHFMEVPLEVEKSTISYLRISFTGLVFVSIYFVFQGLMRGIGNVKTPLYICFWTVLLNIILDPLFIFGYGVFPSFGVVGAAVATVISQAVSAIIGVIILFCKNKGISLKKQDFKPDIPLIIKMFKLGLPSSLEQSAVSLGITFMVTMVATFGTVSIASYGIGSRIYNFVLVPTFGLSMATSTLVGQNIGAEDIEEAEKVTKLGILIIFILLTFIGILLFIFSREIATLLIPKNNDVIKMSSLFIKIMSLTFGFMGIQHIITGTFRASGNTFMSMILAILSHWVFRIPLAFLLSKHTFLKINGIWLSFPIAHFLSALVSTIWFSRGIWKKKKLIKEFEIEKM